MCLTHKSAKIKVGYMKNSSQRAALHFMLSMFCPILANLKYEHTEGGNEHAKSNSSSTQKFIKHTCYSVWMKVLLWEVERAYRNAKQS